MGYFVEILLHSGVRFKIPFMPNEDFYKIKDAIEKKANGSFNINGAVNYLLPYSSISMISWHDMEDSKPAIDHMIASYPEAIGYGRLEEVFYDNLKTEDPNIQESEE